MDTSAVVAYLAGDGPASVSARFLFDELVAGGRNPAVMPATSAAEALLGPVAAGGRSAMIIRTFLLGFPGLSIGSADLQVAAEAARIRVLTGISLPDALVAGTASVSGSRWLITNDVALRDGLRGFAWQTEIVVLSEARLSSTGRGA